MGDKVRIYTEESGENVRIMYNDERLKGLEPESVREMKAYPEDEVSDYVYEMQKEREGFWRILEDEYEIQLTKPARYQLSLPEEKYTRISFNTSSGRISSIPIKTQDPGRILEFVANFERETDGEVNKALIMREELERKYKLLKVITDNSPYTESILKAYKNLKDYHNNVEDIEALLKSMNICLYMILGEKECK